MAKNTDETGAKRYSIDDLKTIVAAGLSVAEAKALLEEGYDPADVLEIAHMQAAKTKEAATDAQTATAKAMQKAMRPENEAHPDISVYSNPRGERDDPKPKPRYAALWYFGFPVHMFPENQTPRELELMNQVEPGDYIIVRKDRSTMRMQVTCERDGLNNISRLDIGLPPGARIDRQDKWLLPAQSILLYQLVYAKTGTPQSVYLRAMQEYLAQELQDAEAVTA